MAEVVITGIGVVTPFGSGKLHLKDALENRASLPLASLDELQGSCLADLKAAVPSDLERSVQRASLPPRLMMYASSAGLLGCLAAKEAAEDAGIGGRFAPERVGLFAATGLTIPAFHNTAGFLQECRGSDGSFSAASLGEKGLRLLNPLDSFKILPNMAACILSILLGIKGPSLIFCPWEEQAAAAILEAARAVASGDVDCAMTGAADWPASASSLIFLRQSGFIREAEVVSASAAYMVLERAETVRRESRKMYGRLTDLRLCNGRETRQDPLSVALGRAFAVAPALLVAVNSLGLTAESSLVGTRGGRFSFSIDRSTQPLSSGVVVQ